MLELEETKAGVVRCLAAREVLERFPVIPGAIRCRVAPDELLLLVPARPPEEVVAEAVAALGEDGLVVDQSGGWTVWTLTGAEKEEALARLSAVPPRSGFLQGRIADVPAKAVVLDNRVHLLVAASHGAYVEERIRSACQDLLPAWWEQFPQPEPDLQLESELDPSSGPEGEPMSEPESGSAAEPESGRPPELPSPSAPPPGEEA